ncbi:MAG: AAA family ATPase [Christensenellales bacterium]
MPLEACRESANTSDPFAGSRLCPSPDSVHAGSHARRHHRHQCAGEGREGQRGIHVPPGPIFSHIVLADEINRATPKSRARCGKPCRSIR